MLQRAFGCKREEGDGRRKLGYEELMCFSADIFRVIKSRKRKWLGHVAGIKLKRRDYFSDLGMDLRIIVTWIGFEGTDEVCLAQEWGRWLPVSCAVMSCQVV